MNKFNLLPWKWKLTLGLSVCIFLTYSVFSFFEFHMVSSWLQNQEEEDVKQTMNQVIEELKGNMGENEKNNELLLEKLNSHDQLIRVLDEKGQVVFSILDGSFSTIEPNALFKDKQIHYITIGEQKSLVYSEEVTFDSFKGSVEIIRSLQSFQKVREHLAVAMSLFAIAALLICAIIGYFISHLLLKPLNSMTNTMKNIQQTGFKERMNVYPQKDEISELSTIFNEMMDVLENSFQQQKQFIEDASHELRTPVSILEGHLSMLNRWGKNNQEILEESLQASTEEVAKLKKLIISLLDLSKLGQNTIKSDLSSNRLKEIIEQTIRDFKMLNENFQFKVHLESLSLQKISEQHFQQIITILLDNATKYSFQQGTIKVHTYEIDSYFFLEITDQGFGIAKEDLEKVFDRFYRVDKARSRERGGTGLGLSIAKKLVEAYEGSIRMESELGRGTKVLVRFRI
ncbi:ATP-binding protein [Bacillus sp. B1-b2]|uniref:ATP-binding protein n=1 Tax=Bacillus sp. B1-b2 TaxID=2653201 RepID=UPI0018697C62|nr:ATP-binding protein [Bacillus sp. B1-b2]